MGVLGFSPVIAASTTTPSAMITPGAGLFEAHFGAPRSARAGRLAYPQAESRFRSLLSESEANDSRAAAENPVPANYLVKDTAKKREPPERQSARAAETALAVSPGASKSNDAPSPTVQNPAAKPVSAQQESSHAEPLEGHAPITSPPDDGDRLSAARALVSSTLARSVLFAFLKAATDRARAGTAAIVSGEARPAKLFTEIPQPVDNGIVVRPEPQSDSAQGLGAAGGRSESDDRSLPVESGRPANAARSEALLKARFELTSGVPLEQDASSVPDGGDGDGDADGGEPPPAPGSKSDPAVALKPDSEVPHSAREMAPLRPGRDRSEISPYAVSGSNTISPAARASFPPPQEFQPGAVSEPGGQVHGSASLPHDRQAAPDGFGAPSRLVEQARPAAGWHAGASSQLPAFPEPVRGAAPRAVPEPPHLAASFAVLAGGAGSRIPASPPDALARSSTESSSGSSTVHRRPDPVQVAHGEATQDAGNPLRNVRPAPAAAVNADAPNQATPPIAPGTGFSVRPEPRHPYLAPHAARLAYSAWPANENQNAGVAPQAALTQHHSPSPADPAIAAGIGAALGAPRTAAPGGRTPAESLHSEAGEYRTAGPASGSQPLRGDVPPGEAAQAAAIAPCRDFAAPVRQSGAAVKSSAGAPPDPAQLQGQSPNTPIPGEPAAASGTRNGPQSASAAVNAAAPLTPAHPMPVAPSTTMGPPPPLTPDSPREIRNAEVRTLARSAAERVVELAELRRQAVGREMNIVLRDDTLGRVGLRLAERAGVVQTVIRSDSFHGAKIIGNAIPALLESLSERGMPVSSQPHGGAGDEPQQRPFDQHAGRGRHYRQAAKDGRRAVRGTNIFRLAVR